MKRLVCFEQNPWLKTYISRNTKKRSATKNQFLREFCRKLNIVFFCTTIKVLPNRENIKSVKSDDTEKKRNYNENQHLQDSNLLVSLMVLLFKMRYLRLEAILLSFLCAINFRRTYVWSSIQSIKTKSWRVRITS